MAWGAAYQRRMAEKKDKAKDKDEQEEALDKALDVSPKEDFEAYPPQKPDRLPRTTGSANKERSIFNRMKTRRGPKPQKA